MIDKDILEASINIVQRAFEDCLVYATAIKEGVTKPTDKDLILYIQRAAARAELICKYTLKNLTKDE